MFIAGTNFSLHYWALRGKLQHYFFNPEFCFYIGIILVTTGMVLVSRLVQGGVFSEGLFRGSLFQIVSIVTTTGFVTENYERWPFGAQALLVALMMFGGCTSSTGGGMKQVRVMVRL